MFCLYLLLSAYNHKLLMNIMPYHILKCNTIYTIWNLQDIYQIWKIINDNNVVQVSDVVEYSDVVSLDQVC